MQTLSAEKHKNTVILWTMALLRCSISCTKVFLSGSIRLLCSNQTQHTSVKLSDDQRKLELKDSSAVTPSAAWYHGVWLRHNCRCPQCYSPSTNMMKVELSEVASCKVIESVRIEGCNLLVRWCNSDHKGIFPLDWLKSNAYTSLDEGRNKEDLQQPLIAKSFPVSNFTEIIDSDEATYKWLRDVNYYGVSFIKGINEPEKASRMLATKFPNLLHYYGEIHNVILKENIDDLGEGTGKLILHQDLLYYENPPGLQVFNCIRNDPCVKGGESILIDLYPIVMKMKESYPEYFKTLTSVPVTFQRKIMGTCKKFDMRMTRHHIQLNRFGQVASINWNIAHPEPLCVSEELVEGYYDALSTMERLIHESPYKLIHRLVPGECIAFNNRRMVHGREKFIPNGGKRHFNGFYAHTDYIRSQFLVLGKKLGKNEPSANVFMTSV